MLLVLLCGPGLFRCLNGKDPLLGNHEAFSLRGYRLRSAGGIPLDARLAVRGDAIVQGSLWKSDRTFLARPTLGT